MEVMYLSESFREDDYFYHFCYSKFHNVYIMTKINLVTGFVNFVSSTLLEFPAAVFFTLTILSTYDISNDFEYIGNKIVLWFECSKFKCSGTEISNKIRKLIFQKELIKQLVDLIDNVDKTLDFLKSKIDELMEFLRKCCGKLSMEGPRASMMSKTYELTMIFETYKTCYKDLVRKLMNYVQYKGIVKFLTTLIFYMVKSKM